MASGGDSRSAAGFQRRAPDVHSVRRIRRRAEFRLSRAGALRCRPADSAGSACGPGLCRRRRATRRWSDRPPAARRASRSAPWLTTTLPSSVTVLAFMSNRAVSPVAVWSFWVTVTPPLGFQPADLRRAAGPGRRGLHGLRGPAPAGRPCLLVEHHQRLAAHRGVALHHLHVAAEGRHLVLVADLEPRRFDLHRLVAILLEALQRVRRALLAPGCASAPEHAADASSAAAKRQP